MLKLGSGCGSLVNHIYSRAVKGEPEPYVGMGVSRLSWSDRHAGSIVEVFKKKDVLYIKVQDDNVVRVDKNGISESQDYEYSPNPDGAIHYYRKGKKGFWENVYINPESGRFKKGVGGIKIGIREEYYDFSF